MNREQFNAHLALKGWRPVITRTCAGIWNDAKGRGFGVVGRHGLPYPPDTVVSLAGDKLRDVEWTDISDKVLRLILTEEFVL